MRFFSGKKTEDEEIERLRNSLQKSEITRKKLASELAQAHKENTVLTTQINAYRAEVEKAQDKIRQSKWRQKSSVARANRYKARLSAI